MKYLRKFNEMLDPMGSWNPKSIEIEQEIKNFGFLQSDLLSTIIIYGDNTAKLYLFNYGNYGRVRKYLTSISEDDFTDIGDWLSDRFRDENIDVYPDVLSIKTIDKTEIKDTDILTKYQDGEIGSDVIEILIKMK